MSERKATRMFCILLLLNFFVPNNFTKVTAYFRCTEGPTATTLTNCADGCDSTETSYKTKEFSTEESSTTRTTEESTPLGLRSEDGFSTETVELNEWPLPTANTASTTQSSKLLTTVTPVQDLLSFPADKTNEFSTEESSTTRTTEQNTPPGLSSDDGFSTETVKLNEWPLSTASTTGTTQSSEWLTTVTPVQDLLSFPTVTSTSPDCPSNMMYMECSCQVTCEDPDGTSGCHNNCTRGKTCICPDGYFLQGEHCVPPEECGCFVHGIGVIREGEFYVPTPNCSHICHCNSGIFHCTSYNCHNDEICEIRNDKLKCFCEYGYHSDGQSCIRSTDCMDLYKDGYIQDGAYTISPHGWTFSPFEVYCERGWTVFQRRYDGSVNFDRSWNDYKEGFGSSDHEMWLGNEKLFFITNQRDYELQIDLVINNGTSRYLKYENFRISDEENKYRILFLGGYSGDTGYNYMRYHKQQQFTTRDRDYDDHNQDNCAVRHHGGWWYSKCYEINLNGDYGNYTDVGICLTKKSTGTVELQCYVSFTQMKLRPEEYPRC